MKINESSWDRGARILVGLTLMMVGFGLVGNTAGTVLGVLGLVPLVTGLLGYCPLYGLLGIDTSRGHG